MSSPAAEEESTDVEMEEDEEEQDLHDEDEDEDEEDVEGEEGHDGARVLDGAGAVVEEESVEDRPPVGPTCCVCMEPWTCNDAHRICCIPCGHVYGRSCLERWLNRCGNTRAKCPQCGARFKHKHITNLYAPGNLWDGCCRIQQVKEDYNSKVAKVEARIEALHEEYRSEHAKFIAQLQSEVSDRHAKLGAQIRSDLLILIDRQQECREELAEEVGEMVKTNFASLKAQMMKMVEQNARPMDLIEFMEQN